MVHSVAKHLADSGRGLINMSEEWDELWDNLRDFVRDVFASLSISVSEERLYPWAVKEEYYVPLHT